MIRIIKDLLKKMIDNIDAGNSNLSEDECAKIIDYISELNRRSSKGMSKYEAYNYLHMSRSSFDQYIRENKIPKGRKQQGFTELFWYKEDLDKFKKEHNGTN